ncbi:Retrovirus-related Pol polyprotein from transposon TNT 1-94 [Senna tora]|uniref:Retrovirus-related Pol polyprotein from transposon TNT 1-94 n=1 Tax=Senna tora TaxID=362788 RepID=A0A834WL82_9FABA|nr:Retrovirus-related Pol polyprotein from transposon TNT 1-94 [Senna tora]
MGNSLHRRVQKIVFHFAELAAVNVCQLCNRPGHTVMQCYQRFNAGFQPFATNPSSNQVRGQANVAAVTAPYFDGGWYPDSGASSHVTADYTNLAESSDYNGGDQLIVGNGKGLTINHIGHSTIVSNFKPHTSLFLHSLLHVPQITKNLISVSKFSRDNKVFFEFHPYSCVVKSQDSKETLLQGTIREDGLYAFDNFQLQHLQNTLASKSQSQVSSTSHHKAFTNSVSFDSAKTIDEYKLWHYRLGHPHSTVLNNVLRNYNVSLGPRIKMADCKACCYGKCHSLPYSTSNTVYNAPLELIYTDLWGPAPICSSQGFLYYIVFVDAYSTDSRASPSSASGQNCSHSNKTLPPVIEVPFQTSSKDTSHNVQPTGPKPDTDDDDDDGAKGAVGPPVNCCTMARKLVVSVLSRVVGVLREARERRRMGFATRPSGLRWPVVVDDVVVDVPELTLLNIAACSGGLVVEPTVVAVVVVTVFASETEDGVITPWKCCC